MKVRCPNCGEWVNIRLPQQYQSVTMTAACPTCGHPVTVDVCVKAGPIVGPRETK
jgi:rRNA maturation protein Nop10